MKGIFSTKDITKFKEAFTNFDLDEDGAITPDQLKSVLRALFIDPEKIDFEDLKWMIRRNDKIRFPRFIRFMEHITKNNKRLTYSAIYHCKHVTEYDINQFMRLYGEDLSEKEIDEMLDECGTGSSSTSFRRFVNMIKGK